MNRDLALAPSLFYLASASVPSDAANSIHVVHMGAALSNIGFDVVIVSPRDKFYYRISALEVAHDYGVNEELRFSSAWLPTFRGGGWLCKNHFKMKLVRGRPDYVYGRNLAGCLEAARLGLPTTLEVHLPRWKFSQQKRNAFEALIKCSSFQAVVVISEALSKELLSTYPELAGRVIVAHDAAPYFECPSPVPLERSQPMNVLYAGSLYAGKGMELLLEIAPACPWAMFRILGGTDEDISKWMALIPGGVKNIRFLGRKPHSLVREQMIQADVLVAPYQSRVSVHGGGGNVAQWMSPLKIFEYMEANRPIIASNLPVLGEILTHRRNALMASPDDVDEWVAALQELRCEPNLARSIARCAREDFESKYSWRSRAIHIMESLGWKGNAFESISVED
ncbi:glycosyltransferase family 4 protein [Pseudomonadota bacterium]